ncbi:MAG: acetylxylan esterase [Roseiflexaceae bacterium]|nr:acetylxylan esterase [Roseiflexaceae bacterium]
MAYFDMPLQQLQTYMPPLTRRSDHAAFWETTLATANKIPLDMRTTPVQFPVAAYTILEVSFLSWAETRVAGTFVCPPGQGPFPALVIYHGYYGRRPDTWTLLAWAAAGYAVLAIDVRGQGGHTGDGSIYPDGQAAGWLTKGVEQPDTYYYRGVYVDCVRAVDVLANLPHVDAERIGVTGVSQGGALTLATAALHPRVNVAAAEVPFLCHFERAVTLVDTVPYSEVATYCRSRPAHVDQVFATLSYFDVMNLADRITCPTHVTVGLMDTVCPPSTVFAAYNQITTHKALLVSPFAQHEHLPGAREAQLRWFAEHVG